MENRSKKLGYLSMPNKIPFRLNKSRDIPNYKKMCVDILSNNIHPTKKSKYYHLLKRIELSGKDKQLKLL